MKSFASNRLEHLSQHVAWRMFLTVHALACQQIDEGLQKKGCISFDDYDVLLTVNEALNESLTMSQLADAVLLSKSGMSRRVARLVDRGLLLRKQSRSDGRVFQVRLSASGRRALDEAWETYQPLIIDCFAKHLTDGEARQMGEICQRILDRIGGAQHRGLLSAQVTDAPKSKSV
ncbi:MAG: MarR family transcriptional regulator [Verrucomicrobiae bacterium]|nr:MarR family transcriptional regulator [Verrucomicrobiae bacterium]